MLTTQWISRWPSALRKPANLRALFVLLLATLSVPLAWAAGSSGAGRHVGEAPGERQSLASVLQALQSEGIPLSFSDRLVRADMVVPDVPRGDDLLAWLDGLLAPHGLEIRVGPGGVWLVVPGTTRPRAAKAEPTSRTAVVAGAVLDQATREPIDGVEVLLLEGERQVHSEAGRFRFDGIPSGSYTVEARKAGFIIARRDGVVVDEGGAVDLVLVMTPIPAAVDTIEVTSGGLLVRTSPTGAGRDRVALDHLPASADPWSFASHVTSVQSDRVDVGGSERGRQPHLVAPAVSRRDNRFAIDGVDTTDMAATGTSSVYYDIGQLAELEVSTGGADVRTATAGVAIRMVTRRGTDATSVGVRLERTDAEALFGDGAGAQNLSSPTGGDQRGNRVDAISDGGIEVGGPLVPGRWFGWAAASVADVDSFATGGDPDGTLLDHQALKLDGRFGGGDRARGSLTASVMRSHKRKPSRGAGPNRAFETTWRQHGPVWVAKVEPTWLVGARQVWTAQASLVDGGFSLTPQSGLGPSGGEAVFGADGVWRGGMYGGSSDRDAQQGLVDGSLYFEGRRVDHALTVGASHREYTVIDDWSWPGAQQAFYVVCERFGTCGDFGTGDIAYFHRGGAPEVGLQYGAAWLQDRLRAGRWTLDVGARLDLQEGRSRAGVVRANPAVPEVLPSVEVPENDGSFSWRTISPRLAATVQLGRDRRSQLRMSFARFAQQLGTREIARTSPTNDAYAIYLFDDRNGDRRRQSDEPLSFLGTDGVDPASPGALRSSNRNAPDLRPEETEEWVLSYEHQAGGWFYGIDLTGRTVRDVRDERILVIDRDGVLRPATAADYRFDRSFSVGLPDGSTSEIASWTLDGVSATGGTLWETGERERHYQGATFRMSRRGAARWRLDGRLTFGETRWRVPSTYDAVRDPSNLAGGGDDDGGLHAERAVGRPGADVVLQSGWSVAVEGLVRIAPQRRWGFSLGASLQAREGHPLPYEVRVVGGDGRVRPIQATSRTDSLRLDELVLLDLRLEKNLPLGGRARARGLAAALSFDVFNVLDRSTVLRRELDLSSGRGGAVDATLAPRVVRLGLRLRWR